MVHSSLPDDPTADLSVSLRWTERSDSAAADFGWASGRCLRTAPQNLHCARCTEACPEQALHFVEDEAHVLSLQVTDACHGCGACLPSCPSEALLSRSLSSLEREVENSLERAMDESLERDTGISSATIRLHCHRTQAPAPESRPLHCLRILGPDLLQEWAARTGPGQLTLCVAEDCQHCSAVPTEPLASDWWRAVQALDLLQTAAPTPFRPAPGARLSRRQLFAGAGVNPPAVATATDTVAARRQQRHHAAAASRPMSLPALSLDPERCDSNQVCSRVCPTDALQLTDRGHLRFNPLECLDCGHCTDHCPEQALSMLSSTAPEPRELNRFAVQRCFSCGHEFTHTRTSDNDSTVCPACQRDRALLQDDFHRLFF